MYAKFLQVFYTKLQTKTVCVFCTHYTCDTNYSIYRYQI